MPAMASALLPFLALASASIAVAHAVPGPLAVRDTRYAVAHDAVLRRAAPTIPTIAGWTSLGCYTDSVNARALGGAGYQSGTAMTDEACTTFCANNHYTYAGTEYSQECYCANTIGASAAPAAAADCNMACNGNANEQCGGPDRLNVFMSKATYQGPVTNPGPPNWPFAGCYVDNPGARTLGNAPATTGGQAALTVALCVAACQANGFTIAGVEYSQECYCGNAFLNGGAPAPDGLSGCSMTCNGNASEYCGGPGRLDVYSLHGIASPSSSTVSSTLSSKSTSSTKPASSSSTSKPVSTSSTSKPVSTSSTSKPASSTSTSLTTSSSSSSKPASSSTSKPPTSTSSTVKPTTSTAAPPTGPSLPAGWAALGCYTDAVAARTLGQVPNVPGGAGAMTQEGCAAACKAAGFTIAGIEYADECYCDNQFRNGGGPAPDGNAGCNMACAGSATEICGGPDRLTVFGVAGNVVSSTTPTPTSSTKPASTSSTAAPTSTPTSTGWTAVGCYVDANARTLRYPGNIPGGAAAMTQEACQAACKAAGYTLAGLEYAQECYCDNALQNGGGPAPNGNVGCNMACNGNTAEICGGSYRLTLFAYSGSTVSSQPPTNPTTSPTTTPTPPATTLPPNWSYRGCYVDNANGRIITYENDDNDALTVESCVQTCIGLNKNYTVAGMEFSKQCFCGSYLVNGATLATADTQCNMPCSGNAQEICGDGNRLSIYAIGTLTTYPVPKALAVGLPGQWQYQGCVMDGNTKIFPYQLELDDTNSAQTCLTACSNFGYTAAGLEYGNQCWCGDISDYINANNGVAPAGDCNMICPGDVTQVCGGPNRLNYYTWASLTTFNYATGNAAGAYSFVIGGVIIPLMTIPGVNGKVTFLEKWGTGPPNTTGTYELDFAEINNFTAAWRPLHLKTDIFCSAGLVLPDRVGRQLTIGGWSNPSTYGVRLYWPDGSPGVAGVNDWQENVNELTLQTGRWYPSAMMLANGSILVVGGEGGSNGVPVPNLEILPKPVGGGLVYCDYLERTDPNNLYPFLVQLPSGNIFIGYYNEARVLDPVNFGTVKLLPNIPGAVNNPLAGRTYPLEGTAMILPQYAPYTDPLTVLVCGGSTPYQGFALDNCVSIQPDVNNAQWVLERMPSRRVISCMTALPDGTYLIINGAQQGAGGFGLANDPNLNAVLYNPLAALGNRFTVLANTTVARLYHSEAVLLQDGTVLISGSDPENQDNKYPQEYRVERFTPPYLMGVGARPTFTLGSKDWAYGQQVTITVTSGSVANLKIALMGAVSSTHGNSMGQRTYFPAFNCNGNTCTVTAPPNSKVCPPSWFMVFVLVNGVPSNAQWTRIGGDPGQLGNWPNLPDFIQPGMGPVDASKIQ